MFAYKTNSPDYLDYIASVMTREEILADQDLCGLLENPYIKDNMEVALAWNNAKFGDYQAKYDFVECYLCNGPELDADTLLHYRQLAQTDPAIMEIAYAYFSDVDTIADIREKKYGKSKSKDWLDCFKNPCFYLGDFSPAMGSMGDSKNVSTFMNCFSELWTSMFTREKQVQCANAVRSHVGETGVLPTEPVKVVTDKNVIMPKTGQEPKDETTNTGVAPTSEQNEGKIRPSYFEGWGMIGEAIKSNGIEFLKELKDVQDSLNVKTKVKFGDWFGMNCSVMLDLIDKANAVRNLGDCYRMWSQVRKLRVFGVDNQYGPITSQQLVKGKNADGTPKNAINNPNPTPSDATSAVNNNEPKPVNPQKYN